MTDLVDGAEFGYPGWELQVDDGAVVPPDGGVRICTIDKDGLRRFQFLVGPDLISRLQMKVRWVGVGNGEVVIHHIFVRTRFRASSIVEIEQKGQRPINFPGGVFMPQYVLTLDPPATVRYFGLLSRTQRRLRLVLPGEEHLMHALGGRARDIYGTEWLYPYVWDNLGVIRELAHREKLSFRPAAVKFGIPEDLYDEADRADPATPPSPDVVEKFEALGLRREKKLFGR